MLDGSRAFGGGPHGLTAWVQLPPAAELRRFGRLQLDFALGCNGTRDSDCPQWDHVVQLVRWCIMQGWTEGADSQGAGVHATAAENARPPTTHETTHS